MESVFRFFSPFKCSSPASETPRNRIPNRMTAGFQEKRPMAGWEGGRAPDGALRADDTGGFYHRGMGRVPGAGVLVINRATDASGGAGKEENFEK